MKNKRKAVSGSIALLSKVLFGKRIVVRNHKLFLIA
jgi:hypothetical protein